MDLKSNKIIFQDGCVHKANDFTRLQEQLITLTQVLANIFSDGIITGLDLAHSGEYPEFVPGQGWSIDPTGFISISAGAAKAVNGELLIIEDNQITISDTTFWDQTNISNSGRDVWIYKTGEETIKSRPNILGQAKKILVRNTYDVSIGTEPGSDYPARFKFCTVPNLADIIAFYKTFQVPGLYIVSKNFALKNLTHTNIFDGTNYTGPKLNAAEALQPSSITGDIIVNDTINASKIQSVNASAIQGTIDKTKISSVDGSVIENKTIDYTKIKDYTITNYNLGHRCVASHNIIYDSIRTENMDFKLSWSYSDLKKGNSNKYYILRGAGNKLTISWGTHMCLDGVYFQKDSNGNLISSSVARICEAFFIDSGNKRICSVQNSMGSTVPIVASEGAQQVDTGLILGIDDDQYFYISVSSSYTSTNWICCNLEITLV